MSDQAHDLRDLMRKRRQSSVPTPRGSLAYLLGITGGKGGVGTTTVAVNLALSFSRQGYRVGLWDVSGTANHDLHFGCNVTSSVDQVLCGAKRVPEIFHFVTSQLALVTGSREHISPESEGSLDSRLIETVEEIQSEFDLIVCDFPSSPNQTQNMLRDVCDRVIAVTTPEPIAITSTYAQIKSSRLGSRPWSLLVNRTTSQSQGSDVADRLQQTCKLFLRKELDSLGSLPDDPEIQRAAFSNEPLLNHSPYGPTSLACEELAKRVNAGIQSSECSSPLGERVRARPQFQTT